MWREVRSKLLGLQSRLRALLETELPWLLLIGAGIVLRVRQYAAFLPFGNDEAALGRNIAERSFAGLTHPLGYNQGAPVLYLFIEKAFILLFGNKDYILDIFAFLSGVLALYLMYRIAKAFIGGAGLFAVLALAISVRLIAYAANPKQYSSDVMIALLLVYLAGRCLQENTRLKDFIILGVTGAVGIWVSHPAALVLAGIALVLAFRNWSQKDRTGMFASVGLGALWAMMLTANFVFSLRHLVTDPYLSKYWHSAFMPLPPWSNLRWFPDTYLSLIAVSLNSTSTLLALAWLLLIVVGAVSLLLRRRSFAFIILLPFGMALIAAFLQKFPLRDRFMLFLTPFTFLLAAEGLARIYSLFAARNRNLAMAASAAMLLIAFWPVVVSAKRNFIAPPRQYDMRSVVDYIGRNGKPGDAILVSGGGETFAYYAGSYGLDMSHTTVYNSHRIIRWMLYKDTLAGYGGQERVWVVFARFEQSAEYTRYSKYLARHSKVADTFVTGYARAYLCSIDP